MSIAMRVQVRKRRSTRLYEHGKVTIPNVKPRKEDYEIRVTKNGNVTWEKKSILKQVAVQIVGELSLSLNADHFHHLFNVIPASL